MSLDSAVRIAADDILGTQPGVLTDAAGQYGVRQALNDLNHRVRYVLGEYADPPSSVPLPLRTGPRSATGTFLTGIRRPVGVGAAALVVTRTAVCSATVASGC